MGRTTKTLGFSVPPAVAREIESLAKHECRNKSDDDRWIDDLIAEAKAEQVWNPMDVEAILKESARLVSYGGQQSKRLGVKITDVNRIVHEHRKAERA